MSDIFLSYAHEDRATALKLAHSLEQRGYSVWWDGEIPPGKTFADFIQERLAEAKCVIVLWSKQSVSAQWVSDEATEGRDRRILIPVLIEESVQIPLGFRQLQAANLTRWRGGAKKHPDFELLVHSVHSVTGKAPTDASTPEKSGSRQAGHTEFKITKAPPTQGQPRFPQPTLRQIDHTSFMSPVRDQGQEGSTVGFAVAAALEYQIYRSLAERVIISPRHIYYYAKVEHHWDPAVDSGAYNRDAIKVLHKKGAVTEDVWPYKPGHLKVKPPKQLATAHKYRITGSLSLTNVDEMRSALHYQGPIVIGISVYNSIDRTDESGIIANPGSSDKFYGMHALCLVGYDDHRKFFKCKNSWSTKWGENGYGYLSYEYVEKQASDSWCFWI